MNRHLSPLGTAILAAHLLPAQNDAIALTAGVDGCIQVPFASAMVPPTGLTVEAWITFADGSMPTGAPHFPTLVRQPLTRLTEVLVECGVVQRLTLATPTEVLAEVR